jgi:7-carboxy-7-deazaguanine synthase (Cx14CxxC type)
MPGRLEMSYAVKEMFLTLQGEGMQAGRRAVFVRFAGCNLWTGREQDRSEAICQFCDTDFVGMDGEGGGRFEAEVLAEAALALWNGPGRPFAVLTGGEPLLQVDAALLAALKAKGFEIAVESNGTVAAPEGIDWLCISPKAGSEVIQRSGDELKVVWPQPSLDMAAIEGWDFPNKLIQPMDGVARAESEAAAIAFVMAHPAWRLSVQSHKYLGLK